jgi:NADPH:quinone reductase-like Zn-dependent oxidoreductase
MKAAVRTRYGPPEVVSVLDVPVPQARQGELLVKVHATTVNRTDRGYRAGTPLLIRAFAGVLRPKFAILGTEFAGVVETVGDGVTSFAPGDRVFGYNEHTFGAHAEYMTIPEDGSVATIPGMTFEEVAPGTEGSHYALANLRAANVGLGSDILVHGATGAIGSAAVQLAKSLGASVTAVCRGEHSELLASLGADRVIDSTTEDFTAGGADYDVVFDAVGKTSFARCKQLLRPHGVFLATDFGPFPWNPLLALTTRVAGSRKVRFPLPKDDQQVVRFLRERMEAGEFRPVIDRTYPLDDIVEAYRYVDAGHKLGNVVITVT